ncbi:MAG: pilus assembly protein PilM [Deltaproteobacteria bacterium]|nr:pilus assembly protein PilM [Deltaproteobacteria bacterium]
MIENLKHRYPIAINIDYKEICAVQLRATQKSLAIKGILCRELKDEIDGALGPKEGLLGILKEISASSQFTGKQITAHLPFGSIFSFPVLVNLTKGETIESSILKESKEYLPFSVSEGVFDYPSVKETGNGNQYKVIVTAARRDDILRYIDLAKQAGLVLERVDFPVSSFIRLHRFLHGPPENPVILCHMGGFKSLIVVAGNDCILAERAVPWGMESVYKRIQLNLELESDRNTPRILLRNFGLSFESENRNSESYKEADDNGIRRTLYQIIAPSIDRLIDEIHKIIGYIRSEEAQILLEGMYLYGDGVCIRYLDRYFQNRFNIPAKLSDPVAEGVFSFEGIPAGDSDECSYTLALGLAMRKVSWL